MEAANKQGLLRRLTGMLGKKADVADANLPDEELDAAAAEFDIEADLKRMVAKGHYRDVVKFMSTRSYAERRPFNALFKKLAREYRGRFTMGENSKYHAALLGMLATSTVSEVQKRKGFADLAGLAWAHEANDHTTAGATIELIRKLRPEWVDHLVDHVLSQEDWSINWSFAFHLFSEALCNRPQHVNFALRIPHEISVGSLHRGKPVRDPFTWICENRVVLIPEIERLFTLPEADRLLNSWALESHFPGDKGIDPKQFSFKHVLVRLVEANELDHDRLSRRALSALSITGKQNLAKWYSELFEALNPEIEQRGSFATNGDVSLLTLLGSANRPVTTWAVKQLAALQKIQRVDCGAVVAALPAVIPGATKTCAAAAVRLLRTIGKKEQRLRGDVMRGVCEAFVLDDPKLHEKAIAVLEEFRADAPEDLAMFLLDYSGTIAASSRDRFAALCPDGVMEELLEEPSAPIEWREVESTALPDADRIEPIRNLDDLIEQIAHFWQNPGEWMQAERILDGMTFMADCPAEDLAARTGPLKQLLDTPYWGEGVQMAVLLQGALKKWLRRERLRLRDLGVSAWAGDIVDPVTWPYAAHWFSGDPLFNRYGASAGFWLSKKLSHAMLSLPTHRGGWIDPRVLVERAEVHEQLDEPLVLTEACVALLRTAPEFRNEALRKAANLQRPFGLALRYALGDDTVKLPSQTALQLAAARARFPVGPLPAGLAAVPGPFGTEPAAANFDYKSPYVRVNPPSKWAPGVISETKISGAVSPAVTPVLTGKDAPLPVALFLPLLASRRNDWRDPAIIHWHASIWPANRSTSHICGVDYSGDRARDDKSQSGQNAVCAYVAQLNGHPFGDASYVLSWVALNHPGAAVRSAGVDALANCLDCEWFDCSRWAEPLRSMMANHVAMLNRIVPCLVELARISPAHSHRITETVLASLDLEEAKPPRQFVKLLEFLIEQRLQHPELRIPIASEAYLDRLPKKGKTATMVRKVTQ